MLSQLKQVFTEYNDLSFRYCMEQYQQFCACADEEILFIHVREPEEIARLKAAIGGTVKHCSFAEKMNMSHNMEIVQMMRLSNIPMTYISKTNPRSKRLRSVFGIFFSSLSRTTRT